LGRAAIEEEQTSRDGSSWELDVIKVAHSSRPLRISLTGRPRGSLGVELRIVGRLRHRNATFRNRHVYHPCVAGRRVR
jgi:hypothetical protein